MLCVHVGRRRVVFTSSVRLIPDGVCVAGSSAEGEEGRGHPAARLLPAAAPEGAHPHAAAPPGAAPHHTLRPAGDAGLLQASQPQRREGPRKPRGEASTPVYWSTTMTKEQEDHMKE